MMKLAQMDGQFLVTKMDTAKRCDLLNGPLDGYIASWKGSAASKGKEPMTTADFFFVDGKFRWDSTAQYFPFETPTKRPVVIVKVVRKVQP